MVFPDPFFLNLFSLYSTKTRTPILLFRLTVNRAGSRFRIFSILCPQNGKSLSERILEPLREFQTFCDSARQLFRKRDKGIRIQDSRWCPSPSSSRAIPPKSERQRINASWYV